MNDMIIDVLGVIIGKFLIITGLFKLNGLNIFNKKICFILSTTFYILLQIYLNNLDLVFLRPFLIFVFLFLISKILMKNNFKSSIILSFFFFLITIITEFIMIIIFLLICEIFTNYDFSKFIEVISSDVIATSIVNILYGLITLCLCFNRKIINLFNKISLYFNKKRVNRFSIIISMIMFFIICSIGVIYLNNDIKVVIIVFTILFILTLTVLLVDLKVRNEYEEAKEKYANTSKNLTEYEDMLDKYRINNHENKNQLQMIRHMIKQKDKKIDDYIDNLVNNVYLEKENLLMEVSIIPAGGLRAAIYSKLVLMEDNEIKYVLNIDHDLRNISFFEKNTSLTLKVCNILGIFLDNAIEEVNLHNDKLINIDIYLDCKKVIFEISNQIKSNIEIDKIYNKKYTTKKKGHGYGLSLARDIINSDKRIGNNVEIVDSIFTQYLEIDIS